MTFAKQQEFDRLCSKAGACRICLDLADRKAVLSELNGALEPKVLFIAEAPGRQGADRTRTPFYGDRSGENFQKLLDSIALPREKIFITNAVLCSPRTATDANRKPTRNEISNCSAFLKRTIELIDPPVIATLGAVSLEAIKAIENHSFDLKGSAGQVRSWWGRPLVPLYHPSPQVIASQRGLQTQLAHFRSLANLL